MNTNTNTAPALQMFAEFLLGEGPLDGYHFGEQPEGAGKYWWRNHLRSALSTAAQPYSIDADPHGIRARVADAITGALTLGGQSSSPPPEGHWLTPFWEMARSTATQPPAGWVMVPVEPTSAQAKAAADAWLDCGSRLCLNKALAAVRAGIAAAPKEAKAEPVQPDIGEIVKALMHTARQDALNWEGRLALGRAIAILQSVQAQGIQPAHKEQTNDK